VKYSGNSRTSTIYSENTVKHDHHEGPTDIVNTKTFYLSRSP